MAIDGPESLEKTLTNLLTPYSNKASKKNTVTISRVPAFITDKNEGLHKPKIVPIGPYHHEVHDHVNFSAIEKYKHQYLHDFLERNQQVELATYIKKMQDLKDRADECYNKGALSDDKFLHILLLDGCFILELLFKLETDQHHRLCWAGSDFMTILSDLLLIENQIPFFVLKELYAISKGLDENKSQAKTDLMNLVIKNLFLTYLGDSIHSTGVIGPLNPNINHLLHLYHEVSLPDAENKKVFGVAKEHTVPRQKDHRIPLVIPSASQLLEFGFELRKQDSLNNSDATIKNSTIKIPRLIIDSARKTLVMNLLSFEHTLDKSKSRWTGLMVMMNCMIKNKRDLEILQNRGIVLNLLPDEDDAIQFFRQLSEQVIVDFNDHYYSDLFEHVNLKCEHFFRRRRAAFMHEYFNNRWALISFCSSIFAIFLASVQTLVSVFTYRRRY